MIKGFSFIAYSVKDVPRAKAFYRDLVGLKPSDVFSDQWAEFDVGDSTFGVGDGTSMGITPGSAFSAVFEVDDLDAARERLTKAGVKVTDIDDGQICRHFFVTDPEGNRFGIHQRKEKSS